MLHFENLQFTDLNDPRETTYTARAKPEAIAHWWSEEIKLDEVRSAILANDNETVDAIKSRLVGKELKGVPLNFWFDDRDDTGKSMRITILDPTQRRGGRGRFGRRGTGRRT